MISFKRTFSKADCVYIITSKNNKMSSLHTINIPIPSEITNEIRALFDELSNKYRNKYFKDQNWNPHIALITTQVAEENSEAYLNKAEEIAKNIKPFEITLDLVLSSPDNKYIWINVDQGSKKKVMELHEQFCKGLEEYRDKSVPLYFQKIWDRVPEEQKMKIHKTGGIHDYFPHLSIVKLDPKQTQKAIREIHRKQFIGKKFIVNKLEITKQSFDPDNMFPVVKILDII